MPSPTRDRAQSMPSPVCARAQPAPSQALSHIDKLSELIYMALVINLDSIYLIMPSE
jgi:hypothetical protein